MGFGDIAATIVRFICHLALSDPPGSAQVFFSNTQGGHWKRRSRRVPPWELGSAWEEDWTWWTEISTPIPHLHAQMHVAQQSSSINNNSIPRQEQQLELLLVLLVLLVLLSQTTLPTPPPTLPYGSIPYPAVPFPPRLRGPGGGDGGRAKLDAMPCLSVPVWHGMA
ncbi:hypothetical protein CABS01_15590 [Colletotrichum abscissum]|uniref:Uncharacterized protein n=1 Tax=Colletotrichum abscissum TaxID=1671311 RepID=A0A9P9X017_9PEZI|nr:uncharacterized protein CABS01_15590 [Colletotrichum abscissum]KAI3528545.1 hypothetical protein CABS02_15089 [Colletotrichum abscissum]KAK1475004.1 hypothetical protein CABS01_15590 [Colletotrichum abscissum]